MTPVFGNRWEVDGVCDRFGAALESGLDNSPMYDDIPFDKETHRLKLADVGLTGLYILDTRSLLQLAKVLGREQDVPALEARLRRAQAGLETLWDEDFGFYCNRRTDTGAFSRRISPTNFYALFDRSVPKARRERIAAHYWNPEEFYGEWMLPAIARNDPAFPEQDYWRGRVWAPLNFLVYLAFCQHADLARGARRPCGEVRRALSAGMAGEPPHPRELQRRHRPGLRQRQQRQVLPLGRAAGGPGHGGEGTPLLARRGFVNKFQRTFGHVSARKSLCFGFVTIRTKPLTGRHCARIL